jgi:hypothetical protein
MENKIDNTKNPQHDAKLPVSGGFTWEDYSGFAHRLAKLYSIEELSLAVNKMDSQRGKLSHSHLSAIKATTSMQGQSQRRAHTGNAMRCNADTIMFYKHAIELLELYPQLKREGNRVSTAHRVIGVFMVTAYRKGVFPTHRNYR